MYLAVMLVVAGASRESTAALLHLTYDVRVLSLAVNNCVLRALYRVHTLLRCGRT